MKKVKILIALTTFITSMNFEQQILVSNGELDSYWNVTITTQFSLAWNERFKLY